MDKVLYDLMDWAGIEEIVYSEAANPEKLLGPHVTEQGLLIQAFIPTAAAITVKLTASGKKYPMEQQDDAGFFAVLVPRKSVADYTLLVTYDTGVEDEIHDPYAYASQYTDGELRKFEAGICYDVYKKMGAHPMTVGGVSGVYFSVWAPCAMRVSVVGDFNLWDGRRHQMKRQGDSGIFELFLPGLESGTIYKYEIKNQRGEPMLKADPYANYAELRPNNASVVWDIGKFAWSDDAWMKAREKADNKTRPVSIYEMHLGSWIRKPLEIAGDGTEVAGSEFYNYREIAVRLAEYVKEMGYTHVELMPVMEHPLDASWGYQVTGYYAPTSRYGTPDDFMYFMNYMHEQGIGVILDWVPAHFPRDAYGMACFDGTCVYEHMDPRQGSHPHWGTLIYNYGRPQVTNFLISNALFWAEQYHADGIRMDAVASMLYLDYGKNDGEWVANIYGGHENLEAVEFLKHLNSVFKKRVKGAMLIAEESTAWPQITGDVKDGSLGFDFKWNMGWMNDFTGYMQYDPFFRCHHYGELTFSMLYAYSEDFILVFSHDEVVHGKASMLGKMPGDTLEVKAENLRVAYGFMYGHPGKKLLFMGQEFAQVSEWNENEALPWDIVEYPVHKTTKDYVKALNQFYKSHPALYEADYHPDGFEWVNCTASADNILIFMRKTKKADETLLFVCNFAPVEHEKFKVGVPFYGKYKEIFNSDAVEFGGSGKGNPRVKTSKKDECDERENSIVIEIPPMSMLVFSCTPTDEPVKKAAGKNGTKGTAKTRAKTRPLTEQPASIPDAGTVGTADAPDKKPAPKADTVTAAKEAAKSVAKAATEAVTKTVAKAAAKAAKTAGVKTSTKTEEVKEEDKKEVPKAEAKKIEDKKPEVKKLADKKPEVKKVEDKKPEVKKLADKKPEVKKVEDKKPEVKKLADKKPEVKKVEDKKPEVKKLADKKPEVKKVEDKKPEVKKLADKKPAVKKTEDKKPEVK